MRLDKAHKIAGDLIDWLDSSVCERIEIAGNIRRGKPEVKDIEIVCMPKYRKAFDLFGEEVPGGGENQVERMIKTLAAGKNHVSLVTMGKFWQLDDKLPRNGPLYKRLKHLDMGIVCDLFIVTPEKWGLGLLVRTGPSEYSRGLHIEFHRRGWHMKSFLLHDHPKRADGKPCEKGATCPLIIPTPEEADVFSLLSWPYLEPRARSDSDRLARAAKARRQ